jgi:hypothetical protein
VVDAVAADAVAAVGFVEIVFATTFVDLVTTAFVEIEVDDEAVVIASTGNGGSLTTGNKSGITFAVPTGIGAAGIVEVAVDVAMVDVVTVEVAGVEVVNTGNGIIALSMMAVCGATSVEVAVVAGVEVATWHASPE